MFTKDSQNFTPGYIKLHETGELNSRVEALQALLKECRVCPRHCGVNRLEGELGVCQAGAELVVSSAFAHFGEEPPLVGRYGSGTIFLTHCNLRCIFCQNYDISHGGLGHIVTPEELARLMMYLQNSRCHNINFVTPTHYTPQIIAALPTAITMGLRLPIVYNCGGYESLEVLRLLDGIIDIYMPDAKYADSQWAQRYSNAPDYFEVMTQALKEMHRQVGDLRLDEQGIAYRGLLIRHLVMPNGVAGTREVVKFIAQELSRDSYVNLMDQYRPCYQAHRYPEINRRITYSEYAEAVNLAQEAGLYRGF
ncbi:MAG: radical SAM protein [candidate division KSB1 bacterium]|nr:radical SAM protein [candidate division KSB1 bacterium]